jgi:hypothetical protein
METNLPTPMTGRVYVNLLEGKTKIFRLATFHSQRLMPLMPFVSHLAGVDNVIHAHDSAHGKVGKPRSMTC